MFERTDKSFSASTYDLPPNLIAKPLPVREDKNSKNGAKKKRIQELAARKASAEDDTPREFKRLMQYQKTGKLPSGLDDGQATSKNSKKRKRGETEGEKNSSVAAIPKILPGEKLSDFAARVDQALPLSGVKKSRKSASLPDLPKLREERLTKHEKRLRRLQQQWREEEARIREREEEERDEKEAEHEEELELWKQWEREAGKGKKKKKSVKSKKKRRKGNDPDTADEDDDDDPWAKLNAQRAAKPANPFEVVQAPPQLSTKPKEVLKMRRGAAVDVANVPSAAGSLRRREELAEERKNIVEQYRRLMAEKRQQL